MGKIRFVLLGLLISSSAFAVDPAQVEALLKGPGCEGWIHGSLESRGLFVFTYRNPQNFFDYLHMSLVTFDPVVRAQIAALGRHDKIRVHGEFLSNPSPQKHIWVRSIENLAVYKNPYDPKPYEPVAKIPGELNSQGEADFLVHAIGGDGHILVVEYKDAILPVYVTNAGRTKGLYRNDVIHLHYKLQDAPSQPTHLNIDERHPEPLKVIDSIAAKHGKPAQVLGALVLFPKSPEISINVFAVQELLPSGLSRQYTIVAEDMTVWTKVRERLQKIWDQSPDHFVNGRNKLISKKLTIKVTGTFNEIVPNQANAQIYVTNVDDVQLR